MVATNEKSIFTPNDIDVLLHYYCCPSPHPRIEAPAVSESVRKMMRLGLLELTGEPLTHTTTDRGDAHVKQLCRLTLPTKAWVDERGVVIS